MNDHDGNPLARHYLLPWLLERGLCDPELAALYLRRKPLSKEAFAGARKRISASYC